MKVKGPNGGKRFGDEDFYIFSVFCDCGVYKLKLCVCVFCVCFDFFEHSDCLCRIYRFLGFGSK